MYLLYLDGSGTPDLDDANHSLYVLLGVSVHEGNWFALENRVASLKQRYEFPGIPIELHAKDICRSISEQAEIPGFEGLTWSDRRTQVLALREQKIAKKSSADRRRAREHYRDTESVIHLTRAERSKLYEDALDLVGSHKEIKLFAEVVDKKHLHSVTGKTNAVGASFEQVISRFDAMLQAFARPGSGPVNNGVAVIDNDPDSDLMSDLTQLFRTQGHSWGALRHMIETPFFVDSKSVSAIQLADICGYALRRYVNHANRVGSHEEKQFLRIFHKFDRSNTRLHGVRHYCPARSCDCMICQERGHA